MIKKTWFSALAIFALAGVFTVGCGGPSQEQKDEAAAAREAADDAAKDAKRAETRANSSANSFVTCNDQLKSFVRSLAAINSRLDIGLSYDSYSSVVSNAKVVYDRLPFGRMRSGCITIAVPAEKALNSYVDAYSTWSDCFSDLYCDVDSVEPEMQDDWSKAGRQLASTRARLSQLKANAAQADADADAATEEAEQKETEAEEAEAALE